jgi:hypothetical protein
MKTTFSTEIKTYRAAGGNPRQLLLEVKEAVTGSEESSFVLKVSPQATVEVPLAGVSLGKLLVIDAKPLGGTADVDMVARFTNSNTNQPSVTADAQDIRFGSLLVIADTQFTALSLSNLDINSAVDVRIFILGV